MVANLLSADFEKYQEVVRKSLRGELINVGEEAVVFVPDMTAGRSLNVSIDPFETILVLKYQIIVESCISHHFLGVDVEPVLFPGLFRNLGRVDFRPQDNVKDSSLLRGVFLAYQMVCHSVKFINFLAKS